MSENPNPKIWIDQQLAANIAEISVVIGNAPQHWRVPSREVIWECARTDDGQSGIGVVFAWRDPETGMGGNTRVLIDIHPSTAPFEVALRRWCEDEGMPVNEEGTDDDE